MDGTVAEWRTAATMDELNQPGYFRSLAPTEVAKVAEQFAKEYPENVFILSAVLTDDSKTEKSAWCDEHIPHVLSSHRLYVPYGSNKADFICELFRQECLNLDDILIDDHTPNLIEWRKAGGTAIKWLNGINGLNGTFNGYRIQDIKELEQRIRRYL